MQAKHCALRTCSREPGADCSRPRSSDINQCSPSNGTRTGVTTCAFEGTRAGSLVLTSGREISGNGTPNPGRDEWIALQRDSLARILALQEAARESEERDRSLSGRCSGQLTLFDLGQCSSKTHPGYEREGDGKSSRLSWRVDIPGETEYLRPLMSERLMKEIAGGLLLLPTATKHGNYNRKGASRHSGNGLATALRMLPTGCATDYKSPANVALFRKRTRIRSVPLRDTLPHTITTGHRLTPAFMEWWMGWPIGWGKVPALKRAGTGKSRSRRR